MPGSYPGLPLAGGLAAVVLWGLAPVATRDAVAHLQPLQLLALRLPLAALALLPWAGPGLRQLRKSHWRRLLLVGLAISVGYYLPITLAQRDLPATTVGMLVGTEPLWLLVAGALAGSERAGRRGWSGTALAVAGSAVLVLGTPAARAGGGHVGAGAVAASVGLAVAATAAFAAYTVGLRPLVSVAGALPATAATTAVGAAPFAALAWLLPGAALARQPAILWGDIGFLVLGSTVAGLVVWNAAVSSAGSTRLGPVLALEPLVTVAGGVVLLGEKFGVATVAGAALTLAGVALATSRRLATPALEATSVLEADLGPEGDLGAGRRPTP